MTKSPVIKNVCSDFVLKRNKIQRSCKFVLASSETVSYGQWFEVDYDKERITKGIAELLLHEIKLNAFRKISNGFENLLVEIIARLIDIILYRLPVEYDIEVTRAERHSTASKNRKVMQRLKGLRRDKPDLMIRVIFRNKWEEIVYLESSKWNGDNVKILRDHNKLVQFCIDGYEDISKISVKKSFNHFYIGFGINIAGKYIKINGLIRKNGIKYYVPISRAKIPLNNKTVDEVEQIIHTLLILRVGIIIIFDYGKNLPCKIINTKP